MLRFFGFGRADPPPVPDSPARTAEIERYVGEGVQLLTACRFAGTAS